MSGCSVSFIPMLRTTASGRKRRGASSGAKNKGLGRTPAFAKNFGEEPRFGRAPETRGGVVTLRYGAALLALLGLGFVGYRAIGTAAPRVAQAAVVAHASGAPNWRAARADLPSYPECLRKPIAACVV